MRKMNNDKSNRTMLLMAAWLSLYNSCNAFVTQSPWATVASRPSRLFYTDGRKDHNNEVERQQSEASARRVKQRGLTVPLIGPIPGGQPLLMGGEMYLDPPTPMQWSALEESVAVHQKFNNEGENVTAIKAAPLVAIIDNVSGKSQDGLTEEGRYATLAAVVGISSPNKRRIDTSSESSFMESIMSASASEGTLLPLDSRIRLVGVGRALLRDFFYKLPTRVEEMELIDEFEDDDDDDDDVPIVMAEFDMLTDTSRLNSVSSSDIGDKGARSRYMSPVHAINEMQKVANRVTYLHDNRRKLVAGLKAAQARLEMADGRHDIFDDEFVGFDDEFVDHDGLGALFSMFRANNNDNEEADESNVMTDALPEQFDGSSDNIHDSSSADKTSVSSLENFGLGMYALLSSIPELTSVSLQLLEPYYSQSRRQEEEHALEVLSFVAFRALEGVVAPEDTAWSLQCTNSVERLNRAYDIMWQHKMQLEDVVKEMSNQLRECGEECTDLW